MRSPAVSTLLNRLARTDRVAAVSSGDALAMAAPSAACGSALAISSNGNRETDFENTRQQLESLGDEFAILGREIKKATDIPEDRFAAAKQIVDELKKIDPTKADPIARAMDQTRQSINDSLLDAFIKQLAGGTKEAQSLAKVLRYDMKQGAEDASGGIDGIAKSIIALRPELASTVDKWKADMADAAKFGEGKYEQALNALRAGDPVSRQVADKIKQHLLSSGKIVERGFEQMIKPLERIDPEAAKQARKLQAHFKKAEITSNSTFGRMSKHAVTQIAQMAAAYVGVQEAIQKIVELNRKVIETNREALDSLKKTESGDQRLLQVSRSGDDFTRLRTKADSLAGKYGLDRNEARNLVFSARSEADCSPVHQAARVQDSGLASNIQLHRQ